MQCPLDYSLCNQTVTLYRFDPEGIHRRVIRQAMYHYCTQQVRGEQGVTQERKFTLIIPGDACLLPGDRVYDGIGPVVEPSRWGSFLPVTVPGLSQVQYVNPCFWEGEICHTEAGRK